MDDLKVVLRYFPVGEVAGPAKKIAAKDLEAIAKGHGVSIKLEEIEGKDATTENGNIREETMNSPIEQISQSTITITAENEKVLRGALKELINIYRSPRTVFGSWGSSARGKEVLAEVCNAADGWR